MWMRAICWKVSKLPHLGVTIFVNVNDRYSSFLEIYWILYQPEQHNLNEWIINGKFSGCFEGKINLKLLWILTIIHKKKVSKHEQIFETIFVCLPRSVRWVFWFLEYKWHFSNYDESESFSYSCIIHIRTLPPMLASASFMCIHVRKKGKEKAKEWKSERGRAVK